MNRIVLTYKNMIEFLKALRYFCSWLKTNFLHKRGDFGYIADDVSIISPTFISNPKNVFLYGNNGLNNAMILTTNAKFVMKPNSFSAFGLKVITGNHARISGVFCRNITESMKPDGLDKNVIVESDVWIGCNVTLLSGVIIARGTTIAAGAVVSKSTPPLFNYRWCAS